MRVAARFVHVEVAAPFGQQRRQVEQQRGLAGAVRPDEPHAFARGCAERDAVEGGRAVGIVIGQAGDVEADGRRLAPRRHAAPPRARLACSIASARSSERRRSDATSRPNPRVVSMGLAGDIAQRPESGPSRFARAEHGPHLPQHDCQAREHRLEHVDQARRHPEIAGGSHEAARPEARGDGGAHGGGGQRAGRQRRAHREAAARWRKERGRHGEERDHRHEPAHAAERFRQRQPGAIEGPAARPRTPRPTRPTTMAGPDAR